MKTEVYSWRVSSDLKSALDRTARSRRVPVSSILEEAVRRWLDSAEAADEEEQRRLHAAIQPCIGTINDASLLYGGAENARKTIRERILARHAK